MIKITRMIRFFLMQFMNIADGDLSAKFSGAFKISLAEKISVSILDFLDKNHCQKSIKEF